MLKFKRCLVPALIKEMIPQNIHNRYKLRSTANFTLQLVYSVHKGLKSLSHFRPTVCEILLVELNKPNLLLAFKARNKNWNRQCCP